MSVKNNITHCSYAPIVPPFDKGNSTHLRRNLPSHQWLDISSLQVCYTRTFAFHSKSIASVQRPVYVTQSPKHLIMSLNHLTYTKFKRYHYLSTPLPARRPLTYRPGVATKATYRPPPPPCQARDARFCREHFPGLVAFQRGKLLCYPRRLELGGAAPSCHALTLWLVNKIRPAVIFLSSVSMKAEILHFAGNFDGAGLWMDNPTSYSEFR